MAQEINTPLGYVRNSVEMARQLFHDVHKLVYAYDSLFE